MSPAQADTGGKEGPLQEHKESLPGLETYLSCSLHLPRLIGVIIKCYFKGENARAARAIQGNAVSTNQSQKVGYE